MSDHGGATPQADVGAAEAPEAAPEPVALRRSPSRRSWLLSCGLLLLAAILVHPIDSVIYGALGRSSGEPLRAGLTWMTKIVYGVPMYVILCAALLWPGWLGRQREARNRRPALQCGGGFAGLLRSARWNDALKFWLFVGLSGASGQLLKLLIGRARPEVLLGPVSFSPFAQLHTSEHRFDSMPSGHTIEAFSVSILIGLRWPPLRWPALLIAGLAALSRIVGKAHYPSDLFIGVAWVTLLVGLLRPWLLWQEPQSVAKS